VEARTAGCSNDDRHVQIPTGGVAAASPDTLPTQQLAACVVIITLVNSVRWHAAVGLDEHVARMAYLMDLAKGFVHGIVGMAHVPMEQGFLDDEVASVVSGDRRSWRHVDVWVDLVFVSIFSFFVSFFVSSSRKPDFIGSAFWCQASIHQSLQRMKNVRLLLTRQRHEGCHLGDVVQRRVHW
jgi:hypothetical protein